MKHQFTLICLVATSLLTAEPRAPQTPANVVIIRPAKKPHKSHKKLWITIGATAGLVAAGALAAHAETSASQFHAHPITCPTCSGVGR